LGHMFTPQRDEKLLAGHFADPRDSCFWTATDNVHLTTCKLYIGAHVMKKLQS
jgi:hypothetical protein